MARRKRRRSNSGGGIGTTVGIGALVLIIAALVGTFGYFKFKASQNVALDPETFCPIEGPVSTTAVLLDLTDPVAKPTLDDLKNRFDALMGEVPEGGKLAVFGLTEQTSEIDLKVAVCNPGDGKNVDPITSNPRLAHQRWEDAYRQPLGAFIEGLSNEASASYSPIMAGIQQIALTEFNSRREGGGRRLIVVSDMLEHTDVFSHYREGTSMAAYEAGPADDMFRTDLQGVSVTVMLIQRLNPPASPVQLSDFWTRWFGDYKAELNNVVRLAGAT